MTVTIANILIAQASHNKGRQPALRWYLAAILVLTALVAFITPAMADNVTARPDNPSQGALLPASRRRVLAISPTPSPFSARWPNRAM